MKKEYVLQGLTCANCAAKIENEIRSTKGILSATYNFVTSKLHLEIEAEYTDKMHKEIERIVHKHEPDVLVMTTPLKLQVNVSDRVSKAKVAWLIVSGIVFFAGIFFEYFLDVSSGYYIALSLFTLSYLSLGTKVIIKAIRNISKGKIFDENFLMAIATIGAFAIGEYGGGAAVMLFYQVGEFFQELAVQKSKKGIADLMDIRPDYANLLVDGQTKKVSPERVNIGDIIIIKPGEKIPLDGIVLDGEAMINTSALTGESVLRRSSVSDAVLSGCINQNGVLTVEVSQTFGDSTASKIIDLVENAASKKARVETFITKFARFYTPIVVALGVLFAVVPPLFFGGDWSDWIYRSLVLLIISCPCALVLSIPMGFFSGIGASSKRGILVKGGNYLEALALLDYVVFDKTGTLTKGVFKVTNIETTNSFNVGEVLETAAYAESFSSHPIALSILNEYGKEVDKNDLDDYEEIAGHGVSVIVNGKKVLAGNKKLMDTHGIELAENTDFGTKVYVAIGGKYAGCIIISDEIKSDSRNSIAGLKFLGVSKTIMLTGDTQKVADAVAKEIMIDEVYASLLPQNKVEKVEILRDQKKPKKTLAFVGDGINDAPVLAMVDVGIAMGGLGSDAAIEAADVVLMTDEPMKLVEAIKIARFTKRIVWQNIIFSLGVQIIFLVLGTMGIASIWEAIFADVGVSLIAVFNSMRIIRKDFGGS